VVYPAKERDTEKTYLKVWEEGDELYRGPLSSCAAMTDDGDQENT
jgi:hypothetical protein